MLIHLHSQATTAFNSDASVIAANPLGKIPALIRDSAPATYDSRVITRFLNDTNDGAFYPATRIWKTLTLEATADGIMETAVSMAYEVRLRPEVKKSPTWIEAQWEKTSRSTAAVNTHWMSLLAGPLDMSPTSRLHARYPTSIYGMTHGTGGTRTQHLPHGTQISEPATRCELQNQIRI